MTILSFYPEEDRALIERCRTGTPAQRDQALRYLRLLRTCLVEESEQGRLDRVLWAVAREP